MTVLPGNSFVPIRLKTQCIQIQNRVLVQQSNCFIGILQQPVHSFLSGQVRGRGIGFLIIIRDSPLRFIFFRIGRSKKPVKVEMQECAQGQSFTPKQLVILRIVISLMNRYLFQEYITIRYLTIHSIPNRRKISFRSIRSISIIDQIFIPMIGRNRIMLSQCLYHTDCQFAAIQATFSQSQIQTVQNLLSPGLRRIKFISWNLVVRSLIQPVVTGGYQTCKKQ